MDLSELIKAAKYASRNAYAPYSKFKVGAAVLTKDGSVFTGVNVENASFSATICAERVAVASAVSAGKLEFSTLVIYTKDGKIYPCGVCRQFLAEFGDFDIVLADDSGRNTECKLSELLPNAFLNF